MQGTELRNVFLLRSAEDSANIKAAVEKARDVVCIGSSFIGMETAALVSQYLDKGLVGTAAGGSGRVTSSEERHCGWA